MFQLCFNEDSVVQKMIAHMHLLLLMLIVYVLIEGALKHAYLLDED